MRTRTLSSERLIAGSIIDEEIAIEQDAVSEGVRRYSRLANDAVARGDGASLKPAERMLVHWYRPLADIIRRYQRAAANGEPEKGIGVWGPAIRQVSARTLAVVTMHEAVGACMMHPDGVPLTKLSIAIGRAAVAEASLLAMKLAHRKAVSEWEGEGRRPKTPLEALAWRFRALTPSRVNWWANKTLDNPVWSRTLCVHLGSTLAWALQEAASADDHDKPFRIAFRRKTVYRGGKSRVMFYMDESVHDVIERGHELRRTMRPRYLPMIVKPYPWNADADGGYVHIRTPFISRPSRDQKQALKEADLTGVREAMNAIAGTAWRVNRRVHTVATQIRERGGGIAGIPGGSVIPLPERPDSLEKGSPEERLWKRDRVNAYRAEIRRKAETMEYFYRFGVADRFVNTDAIYFPHQLDFRSRAYPVPPHLNHQGDDFCRGMLELADAKTVTNRGSLWLRIEAANCYGLDKASLVQRMSWSKHKESEIERVARDPMGTLDWWTKADKPWQFLAACFALADGGERLPVGVDGTWNGMQHYTALGRDHIAAEVVNAMPANEDDEPQDAYTKIARKVADRVSRDAAKGNRIAAIVLPYVGRPAVKQTAMTSVYGVTMIGAREQVRGRLREAGLQREDLYEASKYLSFIVLDAIGNVCVGARAIMDWLRDCARAAMKSGLNVPIGWTTPLGMPVVQPYRSWKNRRIRTVGHSLTVLVEDESSPLATHRQTAGFAPNYIHSLDATHMMMTAVECAERNIAFAAVHDSYRSHAATMDELSVVLREQFIAMHDAPLLDILHSQLAARYPGTDFPAPPPRGEFDIRNILNAPYFFS